MTKTKDEFIIHHTADLNNKLYMGRYTDPNIGENTEISV